MTISEMVARNARTCPDTTAFIERVPSKNKRTEITWKRFDEDVNRIANLLMGVGVGKGDFVMHWMMNSIRWLEAYIGIVRTGGIAVPLNFRFTGKDFKYCADVAEPKAAIFDEQFIDIVKAVDHPLLPPAKCFVNGTKQTSAIKSLDDAVSSMTSAPPGVTVADEDPCGLYFTSGTTGLPKPILLLHKNMECMAITEVVHGLRRPGDIWVTLKPFYHTGDWIHWLASLILGGTSVIQGDRITPKAIFEVMHEERGTVAMLLVPWLQDVLAALDNGELRLADYDLQDWRLVLLGAQYVPPTLIERWKERFTWMEYEVNYGLTEASGPGCIHLGTENEHKVGSIGKAGFNWEARLVNERGEDVARGDVGEIVVKGDGVMREYYRNPEKTAEAIRDGWLYTGDFARMDTDDFMWFVDRKKDLVICGGENVYPVEVEEVLQSHPKVHDVGVIGLPDERLGETVVAVITLEPEIKPSPEVEQELFSFCDERLPRYKRPRRIIFDLVPRNPTGKIEKPKLREKYAARGR